MSRYCWESGTIKIPGKEWKGFRDSLAKAWNDRQAKLFEVAVRAHAHLLAEKAKAARGKFEPGQAFSAAYEPSGARTADARTLDELAGLDEVRSAVLKTVQDPKKGRVQVLQAPKKKDFAPVATTKATAFSAGYEGSIHLDHKSKSVSWSVSENNHAVEDARGSYMGRTLFRLLSKVTWTRGSGGEIVGNDEYNRDDREAGGGANYVTANYGVHAQKRKEALAQGVLGSFSQQYAPRGLSFKARRY
jgi:hypothetical protein